jgi:hypothetical protein
MAAANSGTKNYSKKYRYLKQKFLFLTTTCCGSGSAWTRIDFGGQDLDPGGQKWRKKIKKIEKLAVLKCWMFPYLGSSSWRLGINE